MSANEDDGDESEREPQALSWRGSDAIITTDRQFQVTYINEAAAAATEWTLVRALGLPLDRIIQSRNPDTSISPEDHMHPLGLTVDDYGPRSGAAYLTTSRGGSMVIQATGAWMRDTSGGIIGLVVGFPIPKKQAPDDGLDATIRSLIDVISEPVVVLDSSMQVKSANPAYFNTIESDDVEVLGADFFQISGGQWKSGGLRPALRDLLNHGRPFKNLPLTLRSTTHPPRTLRINAFAFPHEARPAQSIVVTMHDVTEHQRIREAMKSSEPRYRRLFETAKDGIIIINADTGLVVDANPFMTELLGYSLEEFIGKALWEIGLFKEKSDNEAIFAELRRVGYVRYDHLPLVTKSGDVVEVEFVSNLYGVDGQHVGQCNIRDISERRRLERVADAQAEAMTEIDRQKDEFLAMLSHELRNPLAPILSAVEFLKLASKSTDDLNQAHEIIIRQVNQLSRLVDDLMEVSRIMTGRFELQYESIEAQDVIRRAVETTSPLINRRHHILTIVVPEKPLVIYADATRLEQVIVNLLANAAKYTESGGKIDLEVQKRGGECQIRIRDSGEGIAPSLLPHVFDLFTQGPRTLERNAGGLGIGLALARKLVTLHDGKIDVTSELGRGSEFIVTLPMKHATTIPTKAEVKPRVATRPRPKKIVVVDDNIDAAASLALLLRSAGHEVKTAKDGLSALSLVIEFKPDVVMLDIGLPELDGFEVGRRIRAIPGYDRVILIAVTGYAHEIDRKRSAEAGLDHYLIKPVDFSRIQEILAEMEVL